MGIYDKLYPTMSAQRSRTSWNDRLAKWETPASNSEEQQIERAAAMVRTALTDNDALKREGIVISPQGSYHNNTNISLESDMDLRAVHPSIRIQYAPGVVADYAWRALGYNMGRTYDSIMQGVRSEITKELIKTFGAPNVDTSGTKAIRVKKLQGSRADVDIAPAFQHHWVMWNPATSRYDVAEGISILGKDGMWTNNFPEQHYKNGILKRENTKYRFKKKVRMLKTLRDELVDLGQIKARQVPSFFVECLVYRVENEYFRVETDDRYQRALRILYRLRELLNDSNWTSTAREINGIKSLFYAGQAWSISDAKAFVTAGISRLEA